MLVQSLKQFTVPCVFLPITISWSLVSCCHLVRGDAAKASPFPFPRTQSKSDDFKQQFPTLFLLFGAMHARSFGEVKVAHKKYPTTNIFLGDLHFYNVQIYQTFFAHFDQHTPHTGWCAVYRPPYYKQNYKQILTSFQAIMFVDPPA